MNRVILRQGAFSFEFVGDDDRALATIGDLWAPFVVDEAGSDPLELRIEGGPPWRFVMAGAPSPTTDDPWQLLTYIRAALDEVVRERSGVPSIHASAVVLDGRAVLFPGDPGSGKTTLALELVDQGGTLVLDDLGLLDVEGKIQGVSRPIGIKADIPIERFADRWRPPEWLGHPAGTYLVPFHAFAPPAPAFSPDLIVFPRFTRDSEAVESRLSEAEVLARFGRHIGSLSPRWMPVLSRVASGAPGSMLVFGDAKSAGGIVKQLLQS